MSASLVGSEMCIRDSFSFATNELFGAVAVMIVGPCCRRWFQVGAMTGIPVSYTHLTLPTICSV
eukprot:14645778-Alexandrium_andersonii.AAC.1